MTTERYLTIKTLSVELGLPVTAIRSLVSKQKIPFTRLGHRSLVFIPSKVREALAKFEVKAITGRN